MSDGLAFDICGAPSAAQLAADMKAAGASIVGLYVYNSSAPECAVSGAFMSEVEAAYGAPCVLPIVTMASSDSDASAAMAAIQAAGMAKRRIGHDLETYALPPDAVIDELWALERAAGGSPGVYGQATTQAAYPGGDWSWGVHAYDEGYGYLPAPYSMWQYTDEFKGASGETYDASTVAAGFSVLNSPKEIDMVILERTGDNGAQYLAPGLQGPISGPYSAALVAAGVPVQPVTEAEWATIVATPNPQQAPVIVEGTPSGAQYVPVEAWRYIGPAESAALIAGGSTVFEVADADLVGVVPAS